MPELPFFALTLIASFTSTSLRGTSTLRCVCASWRDTLDDAAQYAFPIFSSASLLLSTPRSLCDERLAHAPAWMIGAARIFEFTDIDFGEEARGLSSLCAKANRATVMSFSRCQGSIANAIAFGPALKSLYLKQTRFLDADAAVCRAAGLFDKLNEFHISFSDAPELSGIPAPRSLIRGLGDEGLFAIVCGGTVHSLVLRDLDALTDAGMLNILSHTSQLQRLSVSRCRRLTGVSWLNKLLRDYGQTLRFLHLPALGSEQQDPAQLKSALTRAFNPPPALSVLQQLDFSLAPWLDEAMAESIGVSLSSSRIRELRLRSCAALNASAFSRLRSSMGLRWCRLTQLDIAGCGSLSDSSLTENLVDCHDLVSLDVSAIPSLSERAFRAIAAAPRLSVLRCRLSVRVDGNAIRSWLAAAAISRAHHRISVQDNRVPASTDTSFSADTAEFDSASDEEGDAVDSMHLHAGNSARDRAALLALGIPSLPLSVLDAWRALEFDDGACALLSSAAGASLRVVTLDGAGVNLTDKGIVSLLRRARGLQELSLSDLPITDSTLRALELVSLQSLDLTNAIELTQPALLRCCVPNGSFSRLRSLRISGVHSVDDDFVVALLNVATSLERLCLRGSGSALSRRTLDALGDASLRGARGRNLSLTHIAASGAVGLGVCDWAYFFSTWLRREDSGLVALAFAELWKCDHTHSLLSALSESNPIDAVMSPKERKLCDLKHLATRFKCRLT